MKTLIAIFILACLSTMLVTPMHTDEYSHHIPAGYVYLKTGDISHAVDSPVLSRYLMAFPLLFMNLKLYENTWRIDDRGHFGKSFFKWNNFRMVYASRFMVLMVSLFGGLLFRFYAKRIYGKEVARIAFFLFLISPNIILFSSLAMTDMVMTVFFTLAILAFIDNSSSLVTGVFLGLALMSKYSALILLPLFFIKRPTQIGIYFTAFLVLWIGYRLEFDFLINANTMRAYEKTIPNFITPLPSYILGALGTLKHTIDGHATYFNGWRTTGHPLYYLVTFLAKTSPLVVLGLLKPKRDFLLAVVIVFFLACSFSQLQLGVRYLLPIYPLLFIIAAQRIKGEYEKNQ